MFLGSYIRDGCLRADIRAERDWAVDFKRWGNSDITVRAPCNYCVEQHRCPFKPFEQCFRLRYPFDSQAKTTAADHSMVAADGP